MGHDHIVLVARAVADDRMGEWRAYHRVTARRRVVAASSTPRGAPMIDPREVVSRAHQGDAPSTWKVFTRKRGAIGAFFRGSRHDPDPVLVVCPDGVVEYVDGRKPLAVVAFDDLAEINLRARATTMSDSMHASLQVWLDLRHRNGGTTRWQPASFRENLQVVQCVIEAYAVHAFRRRELVDPS